jgi:hypothetical protein
MTTIYALEWCDGSDGGPITQSLHSTKALAKAAKEALIYSAGLQRRKNCEEALAAVRAGHPPWWSYQANPSYGLERFVDESWVVREVAEAVIDEDSRLHITAYELDPTPPVENP